jgi:hypothetical protein
MLLEDFLSPSDNTQAVFRVYIPHSGLMTRLKVKYLLCPTSILSSNFNILVNQYNSGTITAESFIDYPVSDTLNTTGPWSFGIWISGLNAQKLGGTFSIWTTFFTGGNRIQVGASFNQVAISKIKVTLIFLNDQANSVSGYFPIYSNSYSSSTPTSIYTMNIYAGWLDPNNIICGVR